MILALNILPLFNFLLLNRTSTTQKLAVGSTHTCQTSIKFRMNFIVLQSIEPGVKRRRVLEFFDVLNKFICTKVVKRGPTLKNLSSLSEKTRKSNHLMHLQMSLQRQHFLLSYLKTLSTSSYQSWFEPKLRVVPHFSSGME